jgi:hypothetical protein
MTIVRGSRNWKKCSIGGTRWVARYEPVGIQFNEREGLGARMRMRSRLESSAIPCEGRDLITNGGSLRCCVVALNKSSFCNGPTVRLDRQSARRLNRCRTAANLALPVNANHRENLVVH